MPDLTPYDDRQPTLTSDSPQPQWRNPKDPAQADEIELREVLGVLRRNVGLVVGITAMVMAVALVVILNQEPQYRAGGVIRLEDERSALTGRIEGGGMQQTFGKSEDPLLSQLQILRSRGVAGAVVDSLGLRFQPEASDFNRMALTDAIVPDPHFSDTLRLRFGDRGYELFEEGNAPLSASYRQPISTEELSLTVAAPPGVRETNVVVVSREKAIQRLLERVRATPRDQTDVVDVEYTSADRHLAQAVVNRIVEEFQAVNARASQEQSRRRRVFIEEQLTQTDSALLAAQLQLTEFREREQIFSSQQRLASQQTGLMGLEVRREELESERQMFARLLAGMTDQEDDGRNLRTLVSTPGIAQNPVIATLFEQLVRYETGLDSLTTGAWGSAATHPDVGRMQALVMSTREKLRDAVGSHLSALEARVAALDDLRERSAAELATLPATEAEEARLVQRLETVRRMSDQLREEHQRARIAEAVEAGQVAIVDYASLPIDPVRNRRALKLSLALALGLMLGAGGAFLREHLNTSIRQKDDIERVLGLSPLGVVPRLDLAPNGGHRALPPLGGRKGGNGRPGSGSSVGRELVTIHDNRSSGAEAYRTLRTNLLFSQLGEELKTVVVTSAGEGEGKTTVASNLATTFAQQGVRVLVVDADLRKARLHKVFDLNREPGLTEWVMGQVKIDEAIHATEVDRLFVLPSGALPPNPSEILGSQRMRHLVQTLREGFELVIFDTPPLLAAGDAAVLGARADGVVLVVHAGETQQGAAQEAVRQLERVRARILGVVLNDPDATAKQYGEYYHYAYYGDEG